MKDGMIVRELQHRLLCPKRCNLQNGTVKCFFHNFTHTHSAAFQVLQKHSN